MHRQLRRAAAPPTATSDSVPNCVIALLPSQDIVVYTMLKESPFVESDPENADYFYLPLYNYWQVEQLCPTDYGSQLAPRWWLSHWLPYSTTR